MKNEELGLLRNPRHPQAFPKVFMTGHKAFGKPRENIGKEISNLRTHQTTLEQLNTL